jgi:hypothetical protein
MGGAGRWLLYVVAALVALFVIGAVVNLVVSVVLWVGSLVLLGLAAWAVWRLWPRHPWLAAALAALVVLLLAHVVVGTWLALWPWLLAAVLLIVLWDTFVGRAHTRTHR